MILCAQLQEKRVEVVNISLKHSEFELHVALRLLFLFGFSKCGLWQSQYSKYKSDIKKIFAHKTCGQKNVKAGSSPQEAHRNSNTCKRSSKSKLSQAELWPKLIQYKTPQF